MPNSAYTIDGIPLRILITLRITRTILLFFFVYSLRNTAVATPIGTAITRLRITVISVAAIDGSMLIAPAISYLPNSSCTLRCGTPFIVTKPIIDASATAAIDAQTTEKTLPTRSILIL